MNYRLILAALAAVVATTASAKDFKLATLKQRDNPNFNLTEGACETFYSYVNTKIAPAMEAEPVGSSKTNVTKLKNGQGVSVKLGEKNMNVHINFPKSEMGGRSFGWTSGKVGDWSDSMYLNELAALMDSQDEKEIANFYEVIVQMLGCSNPAQLESLDVDTQRVATNFLAIYTAEEYRRRQKSSVRWDDALMQVTLLGAFHGGQSDFAMFYLGKFTDTTKEKGPGVYANGKPGSLNKEAVNKDAEMEDYHQFSFKTPDQPGASRSGINLTRNDFEKMGTAITTYLTTNKSKKLAAVQTILGSKSPNVIAQLAKYFAENKAVASKTEELAPAVSALMLEIFKKADDISASLK